MWDQNRVAPQQATMGAGAQMAQPAMAPVEGDPRAFAMTAPNMAPAMVPAMMPPGSPYAGTVPMVGDPEQGFQILAQLDRLLIREKVRLAQVLVGWEQGNIYRIRDDMGRDMLLAKEESDCCQRQCCPSGYRAYTMHVGMANGPQFMRMERPFFCTCCCLGRPVVQCFDHHGVLFGTIEHVWACCNMEFHIKDANGTLVLIVHAGCCQIGLCCKLPCAPCNRVTFDVKDAASGETVGCIQKLWGGWFREAMTDAGTYTCEFGRVTNDRWRALVLATAMFLSEEYFTRGGQEQRQDSLAGLIDRTGV